MRVHSNFRDRMRAESRAAKIHAERFNAIFCHAIFPCDPDVKNDEHAPHKNMDLDRLLLGICLWIDIFKISNKNWNACLQIENMGHFPSKGVRLSKENVQTFQYLWQAFCFAVCLKTQGHQNSSFSKTPPKIVQNLRILFNQNLIFRKILVHLMPEMIFLSD